MKSAAWLFVGMIVAVLIVIPYMDGFTAYISGFSDYYELVISLGLLLLLFRKNPMMCIDEATLHYLDGTKKLYYIYIVKYIYSIFVYAIGAAVITFLLTIPFDMKLFVTMALLMNLCNVLNWKSYHEAMPMSVSIAWYIGTTIPFLMSLYEVCIVVSFISLIMLMFVKRKIYLEKYKKFMKLINKNMVAFVLHDQVMLANIANEFVKEKRFLFDIKDKMLKYPLVAKSIVVDTLRRPAMYWGFKIVIFVVTVICANEIDIEWLSGVIIPVLLGNQIASYIRDSAYEANKLVLKESSGLIIPYSDWYIALSYSVVPTVLCCITFVGFCIFCKCNAIVCVWAMAFNLLINILWHKMVVSHSDKRKLIDILGYTLSVVNIIII